MKLYIIGFNMNRLYNKLHILDKYYTDKKIIHEIYSDEGIYSVNDKNICKLYITDNNTTEIHNYIDDYNVIIDYSTIQYKEQKQLPYEHLFLSTIEFHYHVSHRSPIQLTITGNYHVSTDEPNQDKYKHFIPTDFYFEILDRIDVNGQMCKDEINELLSLLI
jgi:hypothetical protein